MNGTMAARAEHEARHEFAADPGRPLAHEAAIHAYLAGEAYERAAESHGGSGAAPVDARDEADADTEESL